MRNMRKFIGLALKLGVPALILGVFAWQLDFRLVLRTLSTISPLAVMAAILLLLLQTLAAAQRLVMVVARFGAQFRLRDSFRVTLEGMFFSQTFISFLGGDALRIWRIRRLGLPLVEATSAVLLDRLIGVLVNHLFLLASLPWLLMVVTESSVKIALGVLGVSGVAGFALILALGLLRGRGGYLHRLRSYLPSRRLAILLVEASTVGRHLLTQHAQLARVIFVSTLLALANMFVFAILLCGMGIRPSLAVGCALLVPAVLEIAMLPISIAGWGLREGAAIVAFGAMGLPAHQALGASVAFGLVGAAVSLLGGVLWLADRRRMAQFSIAGIAPAPSPAGGSERAQV